VNLERTIGWTLRLGVAIASVLIVVGLFASLFAAPVPSQNSASLSLLTWNGGVSLILYGLIALIATPFLSVTFCCIDFLIERNWLYVALTLAVLINLLLGLFVLPRLIS